MGLLSIDTLYTLLSTDENPTLLRKNLIFNSLLIITLHKILLLPSLISTSPYQETLPIILGLLGLTDFYLTLCYLCLFFKNSSKNSIKTFEREYDYCSSMNEYLLDQAEQATTAESFVKSREITRRTQFSEVEIPNHKTLMNDPDYKRNHEKKGDLTQIINNHYSSINLFEYALKIISIYTPLLASLIAFSLSAHHSFNLLF